MVRIILVLAQLAGLVTGAAQGPMLDLAATFKAQTGHDVALQFDTSPNIARRLASGEAPDVLVASTSAIDDAIKAGKAVASTRVALGRIGIGVGVSRGWASKPDVASVDALRAALLQADAIIYTAGASGAYSAKLVDDLGIADRVKPKMVQVQTGAALMERLGTTRGRDIGMTMISEIRFGERLGGSFVGPLPARIQNYTSYDAVVMSSSSSRDAATDFVRMIATPAGQRLLGDSGWIR